MNKDEIWEVLQCCAFASGGADEEYLIEKGFNTKLIRIGFELYAYLLSKEIEVKHE